MYFLLLYGILQSEIVVVAVQVDLYMDNAHLFFYITENGTLTAFQMVQSHEILMLLIAQCLEKLQLALKLFVHVPENSGVLHNVFVWRFLEL